jgi:hypothetical protein
LILLKIFIVTAWIVFPFLFVWVHVSALHVNGIGLKYTSQIFKL